MCGIAGQVRVNCGRIAPELLCGMCAAIEHRGLALAVRDELSVWARKVLLDPGTLGRGWFRERVRDMLDRRAAGWDAEAPRSWSLLVLELWPREVVEARAEPVESVLAV
jgi:hypothetical protein